MILFQCIFWGGGGVSGIIRTHFQLNEAPQVWGSSMSSWLLNWQALNEKFLFWVKLVISSQKFLPFCGKRG